MTIAIAKLAPRVVRGNDDANGETSSKPDLFQNKDSVQLVESERKCKYKRRLCLFLAGE